MELEPQLGRNGRHWHEQLVQLVQFGLHGTASAGMNNLSPLEARLDLDRYR